MTEIAATESSSELRVVVNGEPYTVDVDHRTTLLDLLRDRLDLTGTKKGCDHGQCGACTVLLDGRRVIACLILAVTLTDRSVTTIEGIADPLQDEFVARDALQCGYCTPGQLCSAVAMLDEAAAGWPSAVTADVASVSIALDEAEIRERMSGNLCRCGAYANIVAAITAASRAAGLDTGVGR